jgi:hypothetical protein
LKFQLSFINWLKGQCVWLTNEFSMYNVSDRQLQFTVHHLVSSILLTHSLNYQWEVIFDAKYRRDTRMYSYSIIDPNCKHDLAIRSMLWWTRFDLEVSKFQWDHHELQLIWTIVWFVIDCICSDHSWYNTQLRQKSNLNIVIRKGTRKPLLLRLNSIY